MQSSMSHPFRPRFIYIPDTLTSWPWPRSINPYYDICKTESSTWCESFKAFDGSAQEAFNKCDFNLIASLVYPSLDKEGCRIGCDLMNLFFVIDEYTDRATPGMARVQVDIVMDAIRNPHASRPTGEWVGGEISRQFWENAIRRVTPTAQRRFVETFQSYLNAVVEQATDRSTHHIRTIESYFKVRRDTIGAKPSLALNEMYMNLPDHVFYHPALKTLRGLCIDLIIITNDLHSYNREQAQGDDAHNLITIVMHELKIDMQSSINWVSNLHKHLADHFLEQWNNISVITGLSEPNQKDLYDYCHSLGNWVRGNDCWGFESERYFGNTGRQVKKTRQTLLFLKQN